MKTIENGIETGTANIEGALQEIIGKDVALTDQRAVVNQKRRDGGQLNNKNIVNMLCKTLGKRGKEQQTRVKGEKRKRRKDQAAH